MKSTLLALSVLTLGISLMAPLAHAGSSATTLACSSVSGKTIISGALPGQGEEGVNLNVSVGSDMRMLSSDFAGSKMVATVELNAKNQSVEINVDDGHFKFNLKSADAARTKLKKTSNGTSGSFIGLMSGSHPSNWEPIKAPIEVRCYVSDEI